MPSFPKDSDSQWFRSEMPSGVSVKSAIKNICKNVAYQLAPCYWGTTPTLCTYNGKRYWMGWIKTKYLEKNICRNIKIYVLFGGLASFDHERWSSFHSCSLIVICLYYFGLAIPFYKYATMYLSSLLLMYIWDIGYSSLYYPVGPCCWSILHIVVCICWPLIHPLPSFPVW